MIDARSNSYAVISHNRPFKVAVCAVTLVAFLFNIVSYDLAWAARTPSELTSVGPDRAGIPGALKELNLATFTLPQRLGTIKDSWSSRDPQTRKPINSQTIIHIQDAHCNYYAQHKIAEIIEYMNKQYGINMVNLEGGAKDYDISIFTDIKDKAKREKAADYFVKEGVVNGAEYFAINNPEKVTLWGIEDVRLYIDNLKTYRNSLKYKDEVDRYFKNLSYILANLKLKIYSKELLELDSRYNAYKVNNADFKDYLSYLMRRAKERMIDIKSYTNIYLLSQTLGQESGIDFRKANNERDELIDKLGKRLSKNALEELVLKTVEFKSERISQADFYQYLANKAKSINLKLDDFPELKKYSVYVATYQATDKAKIMDEVASLEDKLKVSLFTNDKDRELDVLSKNLALMKNMFNISLTREDYKYYQANERSFEMRNFSKFIEREAPAYKIQAKLDENITKLDDYREDICKFYEYSFKRDKAFLKNINLKKTSIIVTGGFHTENLADMFKKQGISYVSIIPNFKNSDGYDCPYFKLLSGEKNLWIKDALPSVLNRSLATLDQFSPAMLIGAKEAGLPVPAGIGVVAPSAAVAPVAAKPEALSGLKSVLSKDNKPEDVAKVLSLLSEKGKRIVFEVGCGMAEDAHEIASKNGGVNVVATDLFEEYGSGAVKKAWDRRTLKAHAEPLSNLAAAKADISVLLLLPDESIDYLLLVNPAKAVLKALSDNAEMVKKKIKNRGKILLKPALEKFEPEDSGIDFSNIGNDDNAYTFLGVYLDSSWSAGQGMFVWSPAADPLEAKVNDIIAAHPELTDFRPILRELIARYGGTENWRNLEGLELGPGDKLGLLDYLRFMRANMQGVDRKAGDGDRVTKAMDYNDFLETQEVPESLDFIYGRLSIYAFEKQKKDLSDAFDLRAPPAKATLTPERRAEIIRKRYSSLNRALKTGGIVVIMRMSSEEAGDENEQFLNRESLNSDELKLLGFELVRPAEEIAGMAPMTVTVLRKIGPAMQAAAIVPSTAVAPTTPLPSAKTVEAPMEQTIALELLDRLRKAYGTPNESGVGNDISLAASNQGREFIENFNTAIFLRTYIDEVKKARRASRSDLQTAVAALRDATTRISSSDFGKKQYDVIPEVQDIFELLLSIDENNEKGLDINVSGGIAAMATLHFPWGIPIFVKQLGKLRMKAEEARAAGKTNEAERYEILAEHIESGMRSWSRAPLSNPVIQSLLGSTGFFTVAFMEPDLSNVELYGLPVLPEDYSDVDFKTRVYVGTAASSDNIREIIKNVGLSSDRERVMALLWKEIVNEQKKAEEELGRNIASADTDKPQLKYVARMRGILIEYNKIVEMLLDGNRRKNIGSLGAMLFNDNKAMQYRAARILLWLSKFGNDVAVKALKAVPEINRRVEEEWNRENAALDKEYGISPAAAKQAGTGEHAGFGIAMKKGTKAYCDESVTEARKERLSKLLSRGRMSKGFTKESIEIDGTNVNVIVNNKAMDRLRSEGKTPQQFIDECISIRGPPLREKLKTEFAKRKQVILDFVNKSPSLYGNCQQDGYIYINAHAPTTLDVIGVSHELMHEAGLAGNGKQDEIALAREDARIMVKMGIKMPDVQKELSGRTNFTSDLFRYSRLIKSVMDTNEEPGIVTIGEETKSKFDKGDIADIVIRGGKEDLLEALYDLMKCCGADSIKIVDDADNSIMFLDSSGKEMVKIHFSERSFGSIRSKIGLMLKMLNPEEIEKLFTEGSTKEFDSGFYKANEFRFRIGFGLENGMKFMQISRTIQGVGEARPVTEAARRTIGASDLRILVPEGPMRGNEALLKTNLRAELAGYGYTGEALNEEVAKVMNFRVGQNPYGYSHNDATPSLIPQRNKVGNEFADFIANNKNKKEMTLTFIGVGRKPFEIKFTLDALVSQLKSTGENPADWTIHVYALDADMDPDRRVLPVTTDAAVTHQFSITLRNDEGIESLEGRIKADINCRKINVFNKEDMQKIPPSDFVFFRHLLYMPTYYHSIIEDKVNSKEAADSPKNLLNFIALLHIFSMSKPGTILVTEPSSDISDQTPASQKPMIAYPGTSTETGTGIYRIDEPGALSNMTPDGLRDYVISHAAPAAKAAAVAPAPKTRHAQSVTIVNAGEFKYFNPAMLVTNGKLVCLFARRVAKGDNTSHWHKSDIVRLKPVGDTGTEFEVDEKFLIEGAEDPRVMRVGGEYGMTFVRPENEGHSWHSRFVKLKEDGTLKSPGEEFRLGNPNINSKNAYLVELPEGKIAFIDRANEGTERPAIQVYMFNNLKEALETPAEYWANNGVEAATILRPEGGIAHVGFNTIIGEVSYNDGKAYLALAHRAKAGLTYTAKEYTTAIILLRLNPNTGRLELLGRPVELAQPEVKQEGDVIGVNYETAAGIITKDGVPVVVSYAGINDFSMDRIDEKSLKELLEIFSDGQVSVPAEVNDWNSRIANYVKWASLQTPAGLNDSEKDLAVDVASTIIALSETTQMNDYFIGLELKNFGFDVPPDLNSLTNDKVMEILEKYLKEHNAGLENTGLIKTAIIDLVNEWKIKDKTPLEKFDAFIKPYPELGKEAIIQRLRSALTNLAPGADKEAAEILNMLKYAIGVCVSARDLLNSTNVPDKPTFMFIPILSDKLSKLEPDVMRREAQDALKSVKDDLWRGFRINTITVVFYNGAIEYGSKDDLRTKMALQPDLRQDNTIIYIDGNKNEAGSYKTISKDFVTVRDIAREGGSFRTGYISVRGHVTLGLGLLQIMKTPDDNTYYQKILGLMARLSYNGYGVESLPRDAKRFIEALKNGDLNIMLPPMKEENINENMRDYIATEAAAMKSV